MALDLTAGCTFTGPALPEPFVKYNPEAEFNRLSLLPKATGAEARALAGHWNFVRHKLGALVSRGGGLRVQNHVIKPLLAQLGYVSLWREQLGETWREAGTAFTGPGQSGDGAR